MSLFDAIRRKPPDDGLPPGMVPADKLAAQTRKSAPQPGPAVPPPADLVAERDRLVERFTTMQADLGGVFYEMAIRDHVRLDVLTAKAAELQRVDAELADVERALRGDDGPVAGACPSCGAAHGVDAQFCSRCGFALPARDAAPSAAGAATPPAAPASPAAPAVNGTGGVPG